MSATSLEAQLQSENDALRVQLATLLREARANEDKLRRFQRLEHRLISARSLADLLRLLLGDYKQDFGLEAVGLRLVDRDGEAARVLAGEPDDGLLAPLGLLPDTDALQAPAQAWLGPFDAARHAALFGPRAGYIASIATLPLKRRETLIGTLHFGSADARRYVGGDGTEFLERLADIVAVCLDNALNQERLKLAGLTDSLTGVHNRRYFEHRALIEIAQARRYRHELACMFLDIDHFKAINDTHGHASGDAALRAVGQCVKAQLRAGDTIARWGGEEFVVMLPQTPTVHAREIAERIRASVARRPFEGTGGQGIAVTVSIGLAMLAAHSAVRDPAEQAAALIARADEALYAAKRGGRNRVVEAA